MGEEPFVREERYIVIKRKHLHPMTEASLRNEMRELGIRTIDSAVVERDWPEYETVWSMIEARVTGAAMPDAWQDSTAKDRP